MQPSFVQRYLVPGIVFQSVIIAGGYGTGRELVEFFFGLGIKGGLLALISTGLIWSIICAISFEFARRFQAFDYRSFFRQLLGPFSFLFEISYIGTLLIVLSIVLASAGSIIQGEFGLPYNIGILGLSAYICFMLFRGNAAIEKVLTFWTVMLYAVFGTIFGLVVYYFGDLIHVEIERDQLSGVGPSIYEGIRYAGYNLGLIPAVLFTIRHIKTKKEAITAGIFSGILAIVPAMFIFTCLFSASDIATAKVPMLTILSKLELPILFLLYNIVMLMTLVETGIGLLHAFNERIVNAMQTSNHKIRIYIGAAVLFISALIAQFGLIELISQGYGALTWVIIAVYLIPLSTIGLYKLGKKHAHLHQTS